MFFKKKTGSPIDFMIVGLGNPGIQYENTRHNAGFIALDAIADAWGIKVDKAKFRAYMGEGKVGDKRVLLLKPQTYMNNSGEAVSQAMKFYKLSPQNVLLLFDDISLPVGGLRVRRQGSAGGQNGVKSIIALCGSDTFPRIKMGIGAKPHPDYNLADWVLSKFSKTELETVKETAKKAVGAARLIVDGNIEEAMNQYSH
jgi:PTH1 family peptidyl-tRNA hydrolase